MLVRKLYVKAHGNNPLLEAREALAVLGGKHEEEPPRYQQEPHHTRDKVTPVAVEDVRCDDDVHSQCRRPAARCYVAPAQQARGRAPGRALVGCGAGPEGSVASDVVASVVQGVGVGVGHADRVCEARGHDAREAASGTQLQHGLAGDQGPVLQDHAPERDARWPELATGGALDAVREGQLPDVDLSEVVKVNLLHQPPRCMFRMLLLGSIARQDG
mmetsp:Transcript_149729/g.462301  ORF Transcript_149729/g.462301 Transcript_149729/m.462301 type:complete len:216 (-) Transcript_149729:95-742(-)